MYNNGH